MRRRTRGTRHARYPGTVYNQPRTRQWLEAASSRTLPVHRQCSAQRPGTAVRITYGGRGKRARSRHWSRRSIPPECPSGAIEYGPLRMKWVAPVPPASNVPTSGSSPFGPMLHCARMSACGRCVFAPGKITYSVKLYFNTVNRGSAPSRPARMASLII